MNVFETLFPPRSRAPGGNRQRQRGTAGRRATNRLRSLGLGERLERRDLLAAWAGTVDLATPLQFFIDPDNINPGGGSIPNPMTSQYAAYTITNNELDAKDIWVKAVLTPMGPGETRRVGFGDGSTFFNFEDGIYQVGSVAGGGGTGTAFLYFTDNAQGAARIPTTVDQPYNLEVWKGKPNDPGSEQLGSPWPFKYDEIIEANRNDKSKINTIFFDPPIPPAGLFVGDSLTLKVSGYLGNSADRALFTPATRTDWQPDTFELRSTAIDVSGLSWMPNQIWKNTVPPDGQKDFNAAYTFRIAQPSIPGSGPTIVSPTQFIAKVTPSQDNWSHHDPAQETLPTIPEVKYKLDLTKTDGGSTTYTPGLPVTYTMTLSNTGNIKIDGIEITDQMQGSVIDWANVGTKIDSVTYSGATPVVAITYNPATGLLEGTVNVDVGGSVTIVFTAQTYPSATAKLVNTVYAEPPKGGTLSAKDENDPLFVVQLGITKEPELRTVVAGELDGGVLREYTYEITVTNGGPSNASNVVVVDTWPLPVGSIVQGVIDTSGVGTIEQLVPGGDFTWKIPSVAPGIANSVTLTVTYTVPASTPAGDYKNTVSVTSDQVTTPVEAEATTRVTADVKLDMTKGPPIQPADSGDGITYSYTITVTNGGLSNAANVKIEDFWPTPAGSIVQGAVKLDPLNPIGVIELGLGGNFNWIIESLPPGEWKLTASYTVPASTLTGDYTNNVRMTGGGLVDPIERSATTVVTQPTPTADTPALILGTDDGCTVLGIVRVIDPVTGGQLASVEPYPGFRGSVRVASGDVNGDGVSDIVVAPGRGRPGLVRVFNANCTPLANGAYDFYPFGPNWRGGVEVAVGNTDGVGRNEIVAATSKGKPLVNVFQVNGTVNPTPIRSFRPFPKPYASGVMLTVGDYGTYTNGSWTGVPDGKAEIAVGTGAGVPAQVRIFNAQPSTPVLLRSFLPFGSQFKRGVTLSSARFSSAVIEDVFVGTGVGGQSQLRSFNGSGTQTGGTDAFATFFSKPNAMFFTAALDLTGGNGQVNSFYGAQGRGGLNGQPSGLGRYTGTPLVTPLGSWNAPLRIAPILIAPPTP